MKIILNGKVDQLVQEILTLEDLLKAKGVEPQTVAVERNLEVISRCDYAQTLLHEDDRIEIVKFVGGGA
jgi:sulfur carrier protein